MKKRGTPGLSVGGSSILMIFVLLCLTTFATLSVVSANADLALTGRAVESAERYYEADAQAELVLGQIDDLIRSTARRSADALEWIVEEVGAAIDGVEYTRSGDGYQLHYTVPVSDIQELRVTLTVEYQMGLIELRRTEWRVYNTGEWDTGGIDLWDGELDFGLPLAELPFELDDE